MTTVEVDLGTDIHIPIHVENTGGVYNVYRIEIGDTLVFEIQHEAVKKLVVALKAAMKQYTPPVVQNTSGLR